jgi:ASC-1-like (ASCH) protein
MKDLSARDIAIILIVVIIFVILAAMLMKKKGGLHADFFGGAADAFGGAARKRGKRPNRQEEPYMRSDEPWFSEVKEGRKTVEIRVGPEDRYQELVGKTVKFIGPEDQVVEAEITKVRHYDELGELVKKEGYKKVAPHVKSDKAAEEAYAKIKITRRSGHEVDVFDPERITRLGGLNAVEFKLKPQEV